MVETVQRARVTQNRSRMLNHRSSRLPMAGERTRPSGAAAQTEPNADDIRLGSPSWPTNAFMAGRLKLLRNKMIRTRVTLGLQAQEQKNIGQGSLHGPPK